VPLQLDVNVFVGINASGKTAILDAIAIALYDIVAANGGGGKRQRALQGANLRPSDIYIPLDTRDSVTGRREFVQISAQADSYYPLSNFPSQTSLGEQTFIEWTNYIRYRPLSNFDYETSQSTPLKNLYDYFRALWGEISRSDPKALIPIPVVAYYRAHRRLSEMPQMGDIFQARLERQDAFQHALNAGANYQAMCQWFYLRENRELRERMQIRNDRAFEFPDLRAVRQAFSETLEHVERIFFDDSPPRLKVAFASLHGFPHVLELEQLSDGYRNLLAVVLDVTIYYAFKQSEQDHNGTASTGWDTFLEAVIRAGFSLTGTWPTRTERVGKAMELLKAGLAPFVEREFKHLYKGQALIEAQRFMSSERLTANRPFAAWDAAVLLRLMWDAWNDVFRQDTRAGRALTGDRATRRAQPLGAPGTLLWRRCRSRPRLRRALTDGGVGPASRRSPQAQDGAAPHHLRRTGAQRQTPERRYRHRKRRSE
jgi:hypothetical protein